MQISTCIYLLKKNIDERMHGLDEHIRMKDATHIFIKENQTVSRKILKANQSKSHSLFLFVYILEDYTSDQHSWRKGISFSFQRSDERLAAYVHQTKQEGEAQILQQTKDSNQTFVVENETCLHITRWKIQLLQPQ